MDSSQLRPAIFLDRDGTVIEPVPYISDPARVQLFPDTGPALRRFREAGYALVIVTNQSGIGRGLLTQKDYAAVNAEMVRRLTLEGVAIDAIFFCPEVPRSDDPTTVEHVDRKPGPGMLVRAAEDLGLDLASSWMIGDMISDVLAGVNAGCKGTILLDSGHGIAGQGATPDLGQRLAANLSAAADLILGTVHP